MDFRIRLFPLSCTRSQCSLNVLAQLIESLAIVIGVGNSRADGRPTGGMVSLSIPIYSPDSVYRFPRDGDDYRRREQDPSSSPEVEENRLAALSARWATFAAFNLHLLQDAGLFRISNVSSSTMDFERNLPLKLLLHSQSPHSFQSCFLSSGPGTL